MDFITAKQAAEQWGITANRISILAKEGRIPGAVKIGLAWMIPANTPKPTDGRTKTGKGKSEVFFRYPIFEHRDAAAFHPPLTHEERIIKRAAEAFYACRFEECDKILGDLPETAKNRYIRIYALRIGCVTDAFHGNHQRFILRYAELAAELRADFPYKREMAECIHELDATLGEDGYYKNQFRIDPDYPYHESFLPHLSSLSAVSLSFAEDTPSPEEIRAQEINCVWLEQANALVDLQSMHIYLGCAYAKLGMQREMNSHFQKALHIAEQYDLLYAPALQFYYMRKPMQQALSGFSEEFQLKLTQVSDELHARYIDFTDKASVVSIYRLLPRDDYALVYYAMQGYTGKEVAKLLRIPDGSVGKRYSEIYALLGVKSKQEMIALYRKMATATPVLHLSE